MRGKLQGRLPSVNTQLLEVWVPLRVRSKGEGPVDSGVKVATQRKGGHGELTGKGVRQREWDLLELLGLKSVLTG